MRQYRFSHPGSDIGQNTADLFVIRMTFAYGFGPLEPGVDQSTVFCRKVIPK
jgi:hypothetical protein